METKTPVITVDGPSGSGKGTLSKRLARELGWHYLDSGALYRVLGLAAFQHSVEFHNEGAIEILALHLDVVFKQNSYSSVSIVLEGQDVSSEIRTEDCGVMASKVAVIPSVRQALLNRQRAFLQAPGLVADGRDMGTVVFPNAQLKLFLEASPEKRAKRRYDELRERGVDVSLDNLCHEIAARDERDRNRKVSPLVPADDAVIIDTTDLSIEEVFKRVLDIVSDNSLLA